MVFKKGDKAWMMRKDIQPITPQEPDILPSIDENTHRDTIKRHTIGMMGAVESLYGAILTPKCRVCYEKLGWLTKCKCVIK
jgi:hypothetical protein